LICIFVLGVFYNTLASATRFNQVSIFSNPSTELILQEQIREDTGVPLISTRVFHNKVVNYTRTLLKNAGEYFTMEYLFLYGGFPLRERIPDAGLFYIWQAPFLLMGIYIIVRRKKTNELILIAWWILLLVPSLFTFDEIPNVHRNLIIIPALTSIIALGIYEFLSYKKAKLFFKGIFVFVVFAAVFELAYFCHQYFIHYDNHRPWYRGYAYKDLASKLKLLYPKYDEIIITKGNQSPYIYLLFYGKYDPIAYQNEGSPRDLDYKGFDKYTFVPQGCPPVVKKEDETRVAGKSGVLYVDMGDCKLPKGAILIDIVYWKDGNPAFKLIEYKDEADGI
jgi:hypothetical protein